jgi:tRNA(Ile)-lysidine synthase
MLQRFKDYILQQHLFSPGEEVLLAVSGGRDSVCMAHLFHQAGFPFSIAHCNFHLRGDDSDRDEAFVRRQAAAYGVPCHVAQFDTRSVAAATGESIEEAARRLRYEFFASLLTSLSPDSLSPDSLSPKIVATAHHRDDSIETFFLNLFRGTGIAGLHGIRPLSEVRMKDEELRIIRPLLPFSRADIDAFVEQNHLEYVEDATNAELDARRNQIRHRLMPLLRELYPSVDATMAANIERLHATELLYKEYIETLRSQLLKPYPSRLPLDILSLDLPTLRSQFSIFNFQFSILFELLRPYGFNASTVRDILSVLERQYPAGNNPSGQLFYSPTHVVELHRGQLLIAPDVEPALGRHPQPGDRIRLKRGSRLLSDYLKDLGLSRIERRHVLLRVNADGFVELIADGQLGRQARDDK